MTLPQRNTALERPTNFYYLMCKLDRAQYRLAKEILLFYLSFFFDWVFFFGLM